MDTHASDFLCDFQPTEQELWLWSLAEEYHTRTETYDRTVCTGPILHGEIMPSDARQLREINIYAARLIDELAARAELDRGIGRRAVVEAIQRHSRYPRPTIKEDRG